MNKKLKHAAQFALQVVMIALGAFILSQYFFRIDLTSEKRYTLTDVTKRTLAGLDAPVVVRVYLTGSSLPPGFRRLEKRTREMLEEFDVHASRGIHYEFINPAQQDEKQKKALYAELREKGISPVELTEHTENAKTSRQLVFPGALMAYHDKEIGVGLLKTEKGASPEENLNSSVEALEYEFLNAITKLARDSVKTIGVTTGHGEWPDENLQDLARVLGEYYYMERVPVDSTARQLSRFAALIVAGPQQAFSEHEKFRLDQYIMQGGKILWLLDGVSVSMDSLRTHRTTFGIANELNLQDMLFRYGVRINYDLVLDQQCLPIGLTRMAASGQPKIELFPWPYHPLLHASHAKNPITRYLNPVRTSFVSSLDTLPGKGKVEKTVLLQTSPRSRVMNVPVEVNFDIIQDKRKLNSLDNGPETVAVLLEGSFASVFHNRMLGRKFAKGRPVQAQSPHTGMVVASDANIARNRTSQRGEVYPMGFDTHARENFKGNADFIRNAVNYLVDGAGLMKVRMREIKLRLLDKQKVRDERLKWQLMNTLLPLLVVLLMGLLINFIRKRRFH